MAALGPVWTPPHVRPPSRGRRVLAPALTIAGLGLTTLALHVRDPHEHASWGLCPSAALGFWCPGCGGLRAVNDLTEGHVAAAYSSNFAFMVLMPFLVLALAVWLLDCWRGTRTRPPAAVTRLASVVVLVLLVGFTVVRNLPTGAWFAP